MLETVKYLIGSPGSSGFGSKSTAEEATAASPDLRSLTAIITGATSGIGAEIVVLPLDLSSLSSVRSFVSRFLALRLPLNLLINNAGKFSHEHAISEDGIEMTFATNYLGHFLLTKLLMEKMKETAETTGIQGRIVNVSSSIHGWFSGDGIRYLDLITPKKIPYDPTQAYAFSKLANVLHTKELAERLKEMGANVTANCVHPGIVRTRLTRDREGFVTDLVFFMASKLLKTIPQAAATTCYAATHPRVAGVSGKYFADCNEASPSSLAASRHEAERLWRASEHMVADRPHFCPTGFKHKPEFKSEPEPKLLVRPEPDPTRPVEMK